MKFINYITHNKFVWQEVLSINGQAVKLNQKFLVRQQADRSNNFIDRTASSEYEAGRNECEKSFVIMRRFVNI